MTSTSTRSGRASGAESEHEETERTLRADARRNRLRVLQAAAELLAERSVDASIDEIAARAGVGVGTVYRNFPTKDALFRALLEERMRPLIAGAEAAARADDPGDAFVGFIRHVSDEFGDYKAMADAMAASGFDLDTAKREVSASLFEAMSALFERAQRAGRVRPDVSFSDVCAMMIGLGHADPSIMDGAQRSRCVALVCDSLLVDARSVLPRTDERAGAHVTAR